MNLRLTSKAIISGRRRGFAQNVHRGSKDLNGPTLAEAVKELIAAPGMTINCHPSLCTVSSVWGIQFLTQPLP